MSLALVRGLYDYHRWANHRLFAAALALSPAEATREMGKHFSVPTVKGMFAHIVGADRIWLNRWTGAPAGPLQGDADFADMEAVRRAWSTLEDEQRVFLSGLSEGDLARPVAYTSTLLGGRGFTLPLGSLMQHVANHATHHRSEAATMLTLITGSPPGTDRVIYELVSTGQIPDQSPGWR